MLFLKMMIPKEASLQIAFQQEVDWMASFRKGVVG